MKVCHRCVWAGSRQQARRGAAPAAGAHPEDAGDAQLMRAKGVGRGARAVGERGGRGAD